MKVLLVDKYNMCLDFALRCQAAGHEVRWAAGNYRHSGRPSPIGKGFGIQKVSSWATSMRWADLIFIPLHDTMIPELDVWRRRGFPIFGPNMEGRSWEVDRVKGQEILEECGIECAPCFGFNSLNEATAFLQQNPGRYVSKPDTEDNKALSYVSKSPKDMMFMLDYWKKNSKVKGSFIFQEFIPGIEVAVGGWMGKNGFSQWFLENFEHKKLMDGDVGVNTGEMGTVMKYVKESALAERLLRPLEPYLIRNGYNGFIDVSVIVAANGTPLPLEFTCRPGWPLFQIQQSLHPDPVGWMLDLLEGRDTFSPVQDVAVGVQLAIPDFPYSSWTLKEVEGYPLYGWEKVPGKNLHYFQVKMGEAPNDKLAMEAMPVTAGDIVLVVSGNGKTVSSAKAAAYRNLDKIEIPNSPMYRTDIGARLEKQLPKLQSKGWCNTWEF